MNYIRASTALEKINIKIKIDWWTSYKLHMSTVTKDRVVKNSRENNSKYTTSSQTIQRISSKTEGKRMIDLNLQSCINIRHYNYLSFRVRDLISIVSMVYSNVSVVKHVISWHSQNSVWKLKAQQSALTKLCF